VKLLTRQATEAAAMLKRKWEGCRETKEGECRRIDRGKMEKKKKVSDRRSILSSSDLSSPNSNQST
jgi:hypothetical protein